TANFSFFGAHLQLVPFARPIGGARHLFQDRPRKNVRSVEAGEAQLSRAGIESIMLVRSVGTEHQSRRARFVVEFDGDGDFVRKGRDLLAPETKGAAAEAAARTVHLDAPRFLAPARAQQRG